MVRRLRRFSASPARRPLNGTRDVAPPGRRGLSFFAGPGHGGKGKRFRASVRGRSPAHQPTPATGLSSRGPQNGACVRQQPESFGETSPFAVGSDVAKLALNSANKASRSRRPTPLRSVEELGESGGVEGLWESSPPLRTQPGKTNGGTAAVGVANLAAPAHAGQLHPGPCMRHANGMNCSEIAK